MRPYAFGAYLLMAVGLVCARAAPGRACTIDGQPTLTINGWPVVSTRVLPTASTLQNWAPFELAYPLHPGRPETFQEDTRLLPLPSEALLRPWRWRFGDGARPQYGMIGHHVFRAPGCYRVTVEAYLPSRQVWFAFDAVLVHVVRPPQGSLS